ncbi:MAG TPA: helix-turn-helix transcriptional regulator [Terriglobales bacterium]|nr:helix-turn-helix transcriptional regulator [Terriglobales bacterium]
MLLGDRLRTLRDRKQTTLREIARRTGLRQSFLVRVESGHAVPDMDQLERWAAALQVPVHGLFYDAEHPPLFQNLRDRLSADDIADFRLIERLNGILNKLP